MDLSGSGCCGAGTGAGEEACATMDHLGSDILVRVGGGALLHGISAGFDSGEGQGLLSIKTMFGGSADYQVGRGRYRIGAGRYLLLNDRQCYRVEVPRMVEPLCVFFERHRALQVFRGLTESHRALLDDPNGHKSLPSVVERSYPLDGPLAARLLALRERSRAKKLTRPRLEQILIELLELLYRQQLGIRAEMAALPGLRPSTRTELYRRLCRSRDFIESQLSASPTLDEVAAVAELSPFHFARCFKTLFGEAPGQYQTRRRFELAAAALSAGERSVTDICFDLGFASLGTFSRRFKQRYGLAPGAYRRARQRTGVAAATEHRSSRGH